MNPNQKINGPFGDIFTFNTPYTDRLTQQLYVEQKQREAKQQAENAALDNEFAKNLSGIRDADIPDLTKAYGEWKLANQQAMKKKNGVDPEEQLAILRKKADLYSVINGSKQRKQYEEETGKGVLNKPDLFEDDAQQKLIQHRNIPLSALKANGLDAYDYKYKGTNTDFQKMLATAAGQPKQVNAKEEPVDKEGLQTKITPYMYGNTPLQFKESLLSSLSLRKAGRDAAAIIAQVPPETITTVNEKFKQISPERWQLMGVDKPQELIIKGDETPAEKFAIHQAQLYALNNEPKEGTPIYRTNEAAKLAKQQTFQQQQQRERLAHAERMEGLRQANRVALKNYSAGKDKQNDEMVLNTFIKQQYDAGSDDIPGVTIGDKTYKGRIVSVPKDIQDKFIQDKGKDGAVAPSAWYMTEDKSKIIPLFYHKDKDGKVVKRKSGAYNLDKNDNSTPIDIQNYKVDLGKLLITQKARGGEVIDQYDDVEVATPTTPAKPTKKGKYD